VSSAGEIAVRAIVWLRTGPTRGLATRKRPREIGGRAASETPGNGLGSKTSQMTIAEAGRILKQFYPELRKDADESVARQFFGRHRDHLVYLNRPSDAFRQLIASISSR